MEAIKVKKEFEVNKNRIAVVKCCASCAYKGFDKSCKEDIRICTRGEGIVPKNFSCKGWLMSKMFLDAGGGEPGRIKSPHYIKWLVQQKEDEKEMHYAPKSISQLIEDYEKEFGTRYLSEFDLKKYLPMIQEDMDAAELNKIQMQTAILKDIAEYYSGKTIDNVIQQLESRIKEATK